MELTKLESTNHLNEPTNLANTTLAQIAPKGPQDPSNHTRSQCRICLSAENSSDMISPCDCTGSMKYVHQSCLKEWFEMRVFKQSEREEVRSSNQNVCELCKKEILIVIQTKRECRSRKNIGSRINNQFKLFLVCLIGAVTGLGVVTYGSVELGKQLKLNYGEVQPIDRGVVLGAIVITTLLECYFIYNLWDYFVKKTFKVEILSKRE